MVLKRKLGPIFRAIKAIVGAVLQVVGAILWRDVVAPEFEVKSSSN